MDRLLQNTLIIIKFKDDKNCMTLRILLQENKIFCKNLNISSNEKIIHEILQLIIVLMS